MRTDFIANADKVMVFIGHFRVSLTWQIIRIVNVSILHIYTSVGFMEDRVFETAHWGNYN